MNERRLIGLASLALLVGVLGIVTHAQTPPAPVNDSRTTVEQLERWMKELSNAGRWGKDDELGAANLITPAKKKQALALAKVGETVSMSHNPIMDKAADANTPFEHAITINEQSGIAVERQGFSFHGSTFSHLDALCHVSHGGKLYNDNNFKDVVTADGGCNKLNITLYKQGIVTRGILIDIPRLKGVPYLEPATHVYREDVEAWEKMAGIKIGPGDAIFLRTGRWARREKEGPFANLSGYDGSFAPFMKERDISFIGSDGIQDVGRVTGFNLPIHQIALVALGVDIFDNLDLEALAATAARLKRWEFMFVAAPIPVPNGTGSLVNPIAIF